ncbi:MAG: hypothetical protein ACOCW4_02680, partial [bacterium]
KSIIPDVNRHGNVTGKKSVLDYGANVINHHCKKTQCIYKNNAFGIKREISEFIKSHSLSLKSYTSFLLS